MSLAADQITIAITVYDRRAFIARAIESALNQTVPVRVMVVEDCGPDAGLRDWLVGRFGDRLEYHRNPRRRGLFDNWNACLEYCRTPWLSILHDDDWLEPGFVEAMQRLDGQIPGCALYFGQTTLVDENGAATTPSVPSSAPPDCRRVTLDDMLFATPFWFPGQLIRTGSALALGGFRRHSQFCGDWEMWSRLTLQYGAAQTAARVACFRQHTRGPSGTGRVLVNGRLHALNFVQHKRNLHLLRTGGVNRPFDRRLVLARSPLPVRYLARFGARLRPRWLRYNVGLLLLSRSPHWRHRIFRLAAAAWGPPFVRVFSRVWNKFAATP